ncbi:MAG: Vps62-related protein [Actinobacteria bacterium]|nr:Vps62-related protein [Actinomycetota bacterium]
MRWLALLATLQAATLLFVTAAGGTADATPPLGRLLSRHVPILVLHPAEQLRPVPVEGFLSDSDLLRKAGSGWEKVPGPLPSGGADLRLDQRLCRAQDGVVATSCYVSAQAAHPSGPVVYGAAFRARNRIDLQYWIWYPYNAYSPTIPPGEIWQVHEGDWEAVSVILDLQGNPLVLGLSRHSEGAQRVWPKVKRRGLRPLVHVGLGSHANFFAPGAHRLDSRFVEPALISVIEAYGASPVDYAGNGRVVRPRLVPVTAAKPSWMAFAGSWGEDGYVHFPGNETIMTGAGPRGPAFHEQWQRPVREVLSWPRG